MLTKAQLSVFVILINTFTWYNLIYSFFPNHLESIGMSDALKVTALTLFFFGIAFSALLGSFFYISSVRSFLLCWVLFGVASTALLSFLEKGFLMYTLMTSMVLGFSIGLGFPLILALFAENTLIEKRGGYGGLIWTLSGFFILVIAVAIDMSDILSKISVILLWRISGLISTVFFEERRKFCNTSLLPSSVKEKRVILFLLPWLMFCLVNWTEAPIVEYLFGRQFYVTTIFLQFLLIGVFAFLGGLISDKIGRKRIIMLGFVFLGVEYALLSFFPNVFIIQYMYIVLDSVIWGIFAGVFFMAVWGDLAEGRRKERYYLVGGLPYLLSGYLSILVKPLVASIRVDVAFSLASFFLFLAVIPLMYAPETLPEKALKERELKDYIKKAKQVREKFTKG